MLQVIFYIEILNPGIPLKSNEIEFQTVVIIRINQRKVGKKLIGKQVVPSEVSNGIPVNVHEAFAHVK